MSNSWRDGWSTPFWQPSTRRRLPMHDHTATAKAAARHLGHMSSVKASIPASISPSSPRNISAGPPVSPSSVARPFTAAAHLSHSSPSVPANTLPPSMSLIQSQSQQNIPDSVSGANGESTARKKWSFSSLSAVAPLTSGAPSSQSSPPVERGSSTPIQMLPATALSPGRLLRLSSDIGEHSEQSTNLAQANSLFNSVQQSNPSNRTLQHHAEVTSTLVEKIGDERGDDGKSGGRVGGGAGFGINEQAQQTSKIGQLEGAEKTVSRRSFGKRDDVLVVRRDLRRRLTMNVLGVTTKRRQTLSDYVTASGRRYIAAMVAFCWLFVTGAVFKLCGDWLAPMCIQSNLINCGCPSFSWMGFSTAIRRGTYYIYPCLMFVIIHHAILRDNDLLRIKYGAKGAVASNGRDFKKDIAYPMTTFVSCIILTIMIITAVPEHPFVCLIPCSFCLLVQSFAHARWDGIRATIPIFAVTFFMQGWNIMSLWVLTAITKGLGWSVLFYTASAFAAGFMLFNKILFMRLHILFHTPISEVAVFAIGTFCAFWVDSYIEGILLYYVDEGIGPVIMVSLTTAMVDLVDKCQLFPRLAIALRKIAEEEEQQEALHAAEAKREQELLLQLNQEQQQLSRPTSTAEPATTEHRGQSNGVALNTVTTSPKSTGSNGPTQQNEKVGDNGEANGLHKINPIAAPRTITVLKRTWTTKTGSPKPLAAKADSARRLQSALQSRGKTLGDTLVTEAAASGFRVENSLDYDEFVKYRNVGKAWNWVTFGHEFHVAICAAVLQILKFSPTGLAGEGDCTGNTIVRLLDFAVTGSSYSVFLIPAFTRLFMSYFIPFVVFKRKWLGTSLQMANPAPQIPMLYLIAIYIASSHNAFHQFEIIARFACIGKTENPCIPLSEAPSL